MPWVSQHNRIPGLVKSAAGPARQVAAFAAQCDCRDKVTYLMTAPIVFTAAFSFRKFMLSASLRPLRIAQRSTGRQELLKRFQPRKEVGSLLSCQVTEQAVGHQ